MSRVKNIPASKNRRKKLLKRAKGFRGGRSKLIRTAKETVMRSMAFATKHRKDKKRSFRKLWITRLNAACRMCNISYSKLLSGLKKSNIVLNRKILSEIARNDFDTFKQIVKESQKNAA